VVRILVIRERRSVREERPVNVKGRAVREAFPEECDELVQGPPPGP